MPDTHWRFSRDTTGSWGQSATKSPMWTPPRLPSWPSPGHREAVSRRSCVFQHVGIFGVSRRSTGADHEKSDHEASAWDEISQWATWFPKSWWQPHSASRNFLRIALLLLNSIFIYLFFVSPNCPDRYLVDVPICFLDVLRPRTIRDEEFFCGTALFLCDGSADNFYIVIFKIKYFWNWIFNLSYFIVFYLYRTPTR